MVSKIDTSLNKLNNYHFGRHVFEYFPWYTYENKNIETLPIFNIEVFSVFSFAFSECSEARNAWCLEGDYFYNTMGRGFGSPDSIIIRNKTAKYSTIIESVTDWEDIEKIRLRYILGTKEKSDIYFNIIEMYNKYYNDLNDMMYTQTGEDNCDVSIINIQDFISRDSNKNFCINFIKDKDVYDIFDNAALPAKRNNNFMESTYLYYKKNGFLTEKQMPYVKGLLYNNIIKGKNDAFFYIKLNKVKNIKRIKKYIEEIGMSYTESDDGGLLVYPI